MKAFCLLVLIVGLAAAATQKEERKEDHVGEHVQRHEEKQDAKKQQQQGFGKFQLDERTKQLLIEKKVHEYPVIIQKSLEYFLQNPIRQSERQCFAKFNPGESVDFVIDIAPSPSSDKLDTLSADSPIGYFLDLKRETPSRAYFNAIQFFIDAVTYDMRPEATHTVIVDKGQKYFIRGRAIESSQLYKTGDFKDEMRNLKTMWPEATKSAPETVLHSVLKNNLGKMTKLALWNRNNGIPTVLSANRLSKPVYTVVITDGSSGARINDLVDDLSRTTVIDIGNRRFVNKLSADEMKELVSVIALTAPQQLPGCVDTCRLLACWACGC